MKLEDHVTHSIKKLGSSYADIHRWLDAFASKCAVVFFGYEDLGTFEHRKFRHHKEGIEEAVIAFKDKYPEEITREVCKLHIIDDYLGYLPSKKDFENSDFLRKYHR